MAIVASAPVFPNQKKQCCKSARFTDAPCIIRSTMAIYYDQTIVETGESWKNATRDTDRREFCFVQLASIQRQSNQMQST